MTAVARAVKHQVLPRNDDMATTALRHPLPNPPGGKLGTRVHRQEGARKHVASTSREELSVINLTGEAALPQ